MKKIILLLSLLVLPFITSCEDDSSDLLVGTEWRYQLYPEPWSIAYVIRFGETTFDVDYYKYSDGVEEMEYVGAGTYVRNESRVVLMVDGEIYDRGIILGDQMTFNLGARVQWDFKRQ